MTIDFDGSTFFFPDLANKRIYTKQINIDGTASLNMYELKELPKEEVFTITWENLSQMYKDLNLLCDFNIWNFKKGRRVSFFDGKLFNKNTWDAMMDEYVNAYFGKYVNVDNRDIDSYNTRPTLIGADIEVQHAHSCPACIQTPANTASNTYVYTSNPPIQEAKTPNEYNIVCPKCPECPPCPQCPPCPPCPEHHHHHKEKDITEKKFKKCKDWKKKKKKKKKKHHHHHCHNCGNCYYC